MSPAACAATPAATVSACGGYWIIEGKEFHRIVHDEERRELLAELNPEPTAEDYDDHAHDLDHIR